MFLYSRIYLFPCLHFGKGRGVRGFYHAGNALQQDDVHVQFPGQPRERAPSQTFFHQVGDVFTRFFREFNSTDSAYIEDQHYNYTVMLQNTNTYEEYTLRNSEGQSISFSPDPSYRLGPYLGWRWVFLGYTFDLKHINFRNNHTNKRSLT